MDIIFEDYSTRPVPDGKTSDWLQIGLVIWGINICLPAFMVGGVIGKNIGLGSGILAVLAASVILTAVSIGTGVIGAHTRMSTAMSTKFVFGKFGNILFATILAIGSFGWFGIQLEIFGEAFLGAVKIFTGGKVGLPMWLFILMGGILMSATATSGFKAIVKLSVLVVPALVVLLIGTLVKSSMNVSLAEVFAVAPKDPKPIGEIISIATGAMALGAVIMPDVTRYGKNKWHAVAGIVFGMMIGFPFVIILAAYLAAVSGNADFTNVMLSFHSGAWSFLAMFTIIFATWTTNDNNLYSSALAFNSIFPTFPKWILTVIGGALGTMLALAGILQQFINWMFFLGVTIPPIGAVMLADFFFRHEIFNLSTPENLPAVRPAALISWTLGMLVGYLAYFKVFSFTAIPVLDAVLAAFVGHMIIMLICGRKFK